MKSAETSTSTDGQYLTPETLIRKKVYEDPDVGKFYIYYETDGRVFLHTQLEEPTKHRRKITEIVNDIGDALYSRGFDKLYTLADDLQNFRFCQLFGFHSNYEVWDGIYEVMVKEL